MEAKGRKMEKQSNLKHINTVLWGAYVQFR